jgi:DNA-binding MarR family transcriptional regulator
MSTLPIRQHAVNNSTPPIRTPAGDALSALAVRIRQLDGLLTASGDALARPAGQTSARWWVLASLERTPITVAQVARALGLTRQSVQRIADLLVVDGLVGCEDNPRHRRAKLLRLTETGSARLQTIQANQRVWADAIGAEIGERVLVETVNALDQLAILVADRNKARSTTSRQRQTA